MNWGIVYFQRDEATVGGAEYAIFTDLFVRVKLPNKPTLVELSREELPPNFTGVEIAEIATRKEAV